MTDCRCPCSDGAGGAAHAVMAALVDGDLDRALELGLLDTAGCPGCHPACNALLMAARDGRRAALAARERFRARALRLQRRAAERAARRAPAAVLDAGRPPLPQAAVDALARALAKARRKA